MSSLSKRPSRFQDLSREQAFGLESRILQRLVPLLQITDDARANDVEPYFASLFDLTYLLAEIGLGNQPLDGAKQKGRAFHAALNNYRTLISEKSVPAADAILCVTDALGDLGLIRYFASPGLIERDQSNPDVGMLVAQGAYTLSKIGMYEEVFEHPTNVDAEFIFNQKPDTEPFLAPAFFSRALWPLPGLYSPEQAMPHAFESVILEDWFASLRNIGLSGIVASYSGFLHGINLVQKNRLVRGQEKTVINNVTINLGNGATFTGPVSVGENIRVSYGAAASTSGEELRQRLEEVVGLVSKLTEAIDSTDGKNDVSVQLKSFVEEAKKEEPSKWMLDISSKGLLEAAKTVAEMAAPVATAVKAVLALIAPGA
jgi:hypothetical protein